MRPPSEADGAATVLMALGSMARMILRGGTSPLPYPTISSVPPGLWVCMDAACTELADSEQSGICGKMYSQPRERCECGARVLELYTCRFCGTAYSRSYTDDVTALLLSGLSQDDACGWTPARQPSFATGLAS